MRARLLKLLKYSEDLKGVFVQHLQGHCTLVELLLHAPTALLGKQLQQRLADTSQPTSLLEMVWRDVCMTAHAAESEALVFCGCTAVPLSGMCTSGPLQQIVPQVLKLRQFLL